MASYHRDIGGKTSAASWTKLVDHVIQQRARQPPTPVFYGILAKADLERWKREQHYDSLEAIWVNIVSRFD